MASRRFASNCGTSFCVRGVYNAALATRRVDWARKHDHSVGPLTRDALLAALDDKQRQRLATLETVDIDAPIDCDGTPFTFALFTWEFVQHDTFRNCSDRPAAGEILMKIGRDFRHWLIRV